MGKGKPLGWNGKTLREMTHESERLFKETGRYYGIDRLELKDQNPFSYEQAYARLRGANESAWETALHVAASPIVKEIGELCFALYSPEGDSVIVSTGIMVHVHTMSEAIKFMIRENYEEEVGINPGDIFLNNDCLCGNVHTTDVQTLIPIFWGDEIVGWVGGVTHQVDIGGIVPGHDLTCTVERFDDGVHYTCLKIGSEDQIWKDHMINARRAVRTPMYWELDEKCRLSGCLMIRDAVLDFIRDEGIEYYKQFTREAIEDGRRAFIARVKQLLIPGRYRASSVMGTSTETIPLKPQATTEALSNMPLEIIVKGDGGLSLSFDGASAAQRFAFNCGVGAMEGGQWVLLTQCVIHRDKVNDGAYMAVDKDYPPGTWCNPIDPYLSYNNPWGLLIPAYTAMMRCISYGFFSRGFREEVVPGYSHTADAIQGGGFYETGPLAGEYWALSTFEIAGQGYPASAVADGYNSGYAMWNPEGNLGDIETWEVIQGGIPYLSRQLKPNLAGHGKYRGGSNFETVAMIHNSRHVTFFNAAEGSTFAGCGGMHGGYPQATSYILRAENTNMPEVIMNKQPYPMGDPDPANGEFERFIKGKITRIPEGMMIPIGLKNNDLVHWRESGAPGYGDPLERELDLVRQDLKDYIFTEDVVYKVYGVVARYDEAKREWLVDKEQTEKRRDQLRKEREAKSMTFEEFYQREKQRIVEGNLIDPVKKMYNESFQLSGNWGKEFLDFWNLPEDFRFNLEGE
jgi:N-methylhydantoinase B/acetone carboxylase alpha subunit